MLRLIALLLLALSRAESYLNVLGTDLEKCSGSGMALTGFTRNGKCVDQVRRATITV